jgi:hypothetical protein
MVAVLCPGEVRRGPEKRNQETPGRLLFSKI